MRGNLIKNFDVVKILVALSCGRWTIVSCCLLFLIFGYYNLNRAPQLYSISWVLGFNSASLRGAEIVSPIESRYAPVTKNLAAQPLAINEFMMFFNSKEVSELLMKDEELVKNVFQSEWDATLNSFVGKELTNKGLFMSKLKKMVLGDSGVKYIPPNASRLSLKIREIFTLTAKDNTEFLEIKAVSSNPQSTIELMKKIKDATNTFLFDREISQIKSSIAFFNSIMRTKNGILTKKAISDLILKEEIKLLIFEGYDEKLFVSISGPNISDHSTAFRSRAILAFYLSIGFIIGCLLLFLKEQYSHRLD